MKFGIFYEHQLPRPWHEGAEHRLLQEALEQVELADQLGIDYAWEVEHHFLEEYSHSSAPEIFLAACSQRTKNIRLGHGICLMPPKYNHPARVAERIATLDLVSNGRVEFGTGESASLMELGGFNVGFDAAEKRRMWQEAVEQCANMLVMDPYPGFQGEFFEMPCRNVVPKPLQKPHPPLWVACSNRETIKLAARCGVGALTFAFVDPREAKQWVDDYYRIFKEECVPIGHAVNPNVAMVTGFSLHADEEEARRRGEDGLRFFRYGLAHHYIFGEHRPGRTDIWANFEKARHALPPAAADHGIGTPDQLQTHLRHFEESGVDQTVFIQQGGRNEHQHICDALKLFAAEVMPEFRAREIEREKKKRPTLRLSSRRRWHARRRWRCRATNRFQSIPRLAARLPRKAPAPNARSRTPNCGPMPPRSRSATPVATARKHPPRNHQRNNNVLDQPASKTSARTSGPLAGFRIVEFAGIGPGPFACMMLADMGAEVVTLDRVGASKNLKAIAVRGRKVVELDLKDKAAIAQVLELLANADALIEGFRPGVMERLGLGPDVVLARNPKLVYGRMTGWGQEGPLANAAGHDINYISLTGALAAIGTKGRPVPPLNLVGDFGGGALYLVVGVLAALLEASKSGKGQVVDAAMCDGAASLMSMFFDMTAMGRWTEGREQNFLDGGAHFYGVYECSCGNFVSIGSIEPQFYALLRQHAGLTDADFDAQMDRKAWPSLREKLTKVFKSKTREDWCAIMEGTDICFAPILTMAEAPKHPHMAAREVFVERHGVTQPAPAPRFSRTPSAIRDAMKVEIAEVASAWKK